MRENNVFKSHIMCSVQHYAASIVDNQQSAHTRLEVLVTQPRLVSL